MKQVNDWESGCLWLACLVIFVLFTELLDTFICSNDHTNDTNDKTLI